jgi:membrane protein YqaA with SNARE-associated domain
MDLIGLFTVALVAATLIPAQSEAVLASLLFAGTRAPWILLLVATTGNVMGSAINWWIGRYLAHFADRTWFPASPARFDSAKRWYGRLGYWSLLGSWLPLVGDPLTVVAGTLGEPFWRFMVMVSVAKGGRYLVLAGAVWAAGFQGGGG